MQKSANWPFYILIGLVFILLKLFFRHADVHQLRLFITPPALALQSITGDIGSYSPQGGYLFKNLGVAINKSCAGFNLFLIAFLTTSTLVLQYAEKWRHKLIALTISLLVAYLFTMLTNSFRIYVAILGQQIADLYLPTRPHLQLHEAIGVLVNLFFLILFYFFLQQTLKKHQIHAEVPES